MTTLTSTDHALPLVLQRDGACLREGVARSHGRERNWARTKPRTTTTNTAHHQPHRWVEKVGRSIKGSEAPAPTREPRSRRASPRPGTRTRRSAFNVAGLLLLKETAARLIDPGHRDTQRELLHAAGTRNTSPDAASSRDTRPASTACSPGAPTRHPTRTPAQKQQPSRSPPITNDRAPCPSRVTRASPALCAALDRQPRSLRELQASAAHNPALLIWRRYAQLRIKPPCGVPAT